LAGPTIAGLKTYSGRFCSRGDTAALAPGTIEIPAVRKDVMCPYLGQKLVASPVCFHQNFVPFRLGESPAKQMNPEALSQVLEAVAFIFVTPEFIEERKLTKVRTALDNLIIRIITAWLDPHYSAPQETRYP
jgi:hypothetical protein